MTKTAKTWGRLLPAAAAFYKLVVLDYTLEGILPRKEYTVTLEMTADGGDRRVRVATYLPRTDRRQTVEYEVDASDSVFFASKETVGLDQRMTWVGSRVPDGAQLEVERLQLGTHAAADRILVRGDEAAVEAMASLMSAERIAAMAPDAVLVNTARGDVLDLSAAVEAVAAGRLRGLCCDVFPQEPYPSLSESASIPGVWLTPHASGYTRGLGRRVADGVVAGLSAWAEGREQPYAVGGSEGGA